MEINFHLVDVFAIKYIHILRGINNDFMKIHIKTKKCNFVNEHSCYSKYRR